MYFIIMHRINNVKVVSPTREKETYNAVCIFTCYTSLMAWNSILPQVVRFIKRSIKTSSTDIAGSHCQKKPSMDLQNCPTCSFEGFAEVTQGTSTTEPCPKPTCYILI